MQMFIVLDSKELKDLELALKQIMELAEKKGLSAKILTLKTERKKLANSTWELWIHKRIIRIQNPTESFARAYSKLSLPFSVKGETRIVRG